MLPATARSAAQKILTFAPPPAAPAVGLAPPCYIPRPGEFRVHGAELMLRRTAWSLVELGCIALLLRAIWIWAALGAGA